MLSSARTLSARYDEGGQKDAFPASPHPHMTKLSALTVIAASLIWLLPAFALTTFGQNEARRDVRLLAAGETIEDCQLNGDEEHYYTFELRPGELFQVRVDQKGVDVRLKLSQEFGKELAQMDSPNGDNGPETLSYIPTVAGTFTLAVGKLPGEKAGTGSYTIHRRESRSATAEDRRRVAAEQIFNEGVAALRVKEGSKQAMSNLAEALGAWRELKDDYMSMLTGRALAGLLLNEAGSLKESSGYLNPQLLSQEALDKALAALRICQDVKDRHCEALSAFFIGNIYADTEAAQHAPEALKYFEKTLEVIDFSENTAAEKRDGKIRALKNMGWVLFTQRRYEEALKKYQLALDFYGKDEEDDAKASLLLRSGNALSALRKFAQSEQAYSSARGVYGRLGRPCDEGTTQNRLGQMYLKQHEELPDAKALVRGLEIFLEAEKLFNKCAMTDQSFNDRRMFNLSLIADVYERLNNREKEAEYRTRAEALSKSIVQPRTQVLSYLERGGRASVEGNFTKALELFQKALDLLEKMDTLAWARAAVLRKMGFTHIKLSRDYRAQGLESKAQEQMKLAGAAFAEARRLVEKLDDKTHLARLIFDFGLALLNGGVLEESRRAHIAALNILRSGENKSKGVDHELLADITNSLGYVYARMGDTPRAFFHLRAALWLRITFNDKEGIAETLHRSMDVFATLGKRRLAIFYGKQAVRLNLALRRSIKTLDVETQHEFLRANREIYEELTSLLIQEGRLAEAHQVINTYRDQEFFDFGNDNSDSVGQLELTPREDGAQTRLDQLSTRLRLPGQFLKDIDPLIQTRTLTAQEKAELQKQLTVFKESGMELESMLKKIETDFEQPASEEDRVGEKSASAGADNGGCRPERQRPDGSVPDTEEMKVALCKLGRATGEKYATIYTFTVEDSLHVLLVTPDSIKAFSHPTKAVGLNSRVERLLKFLQNPATPTLKVQEAGAEFYDMIFGAKATDDKSKTLETELEKYRPGVVLWSLDGKLRYIPVAALYDAKKSQYLVEKFQTAVFTRAKKDRFLHQPTPWTEGLGMGASDAPKLTCGRFPLTALPSVPRELPTIFDGEASNHKGIFKGPYLLNAEFTRESMVSQLNARKRPLVHISSHFCFQPGDARSSFLLLGDGKPFSLYEMQEYTNLFEGVDLLVLSACETAAQHPNASGKEIDSFAELAQRLRAVSVIATMWRVDDTGASELMLKFYRLRKEHPDWPKAELLRQAQLSLLKADPNSRRSHPYYWAPFVLYGGFR